MERVSSPAFGLAPTNGQTGHLCTFRCAPSFRQNIDFSLGVSFRPFPQPTRSCPGKHLEVPVGGVLACTRIGAGRR